MVEFLKIASIFIFISFQFSSPHFLPDLVEKEKEILKNRKDLIEINLDTNQVFLFEEGKLKESFLILAKGDENGWNATPRGLYFVLDKHPIAFSITSWVYMPHAVHFWGKYYLHGIPYDKKGNKISSLYSGGCIRLSDSSAKKVFEFAKEGMPVLVIGKKNKKDFILLTPKKPEISAKSFLVADLDSGQILLEKNSSQPQPIGEIFDLLFVLTAAENISLKNEIIKLFSNLLSDPLPQTRVQILELFHDKNKEAKEFIQKKARSILMEETTINSVEDLSYNKSSAKDLFYLLRYIEEAKKPILEITRSKDFGFDKEVFLGGAQGYIFDFGQVGAYLFLVKERKIAIIILGTENLKKEVEKILNWLNEEI